MTDPRLALLDASHNTASTRRNFRRELGFTPVEFDVTAEELPTSTAFDGVIVTGSRSSVYWDEPWIDATRAYVVEAVEADVPVFGVCWGHQLIADALGGRVEAMGAYEIGYREIVRTTVSPLLEGIDDRFIAFTTHSDEVTAIPPGTEVIAENDVSIQGYAGDRVWAVQFHPEYDRDTARAVTEAKDDLDPDRKARALAGITEANVRAAGQAKRVFDNFLGLIAPRAGAE